MAPATDTLPVNWWGENYDQTNNGAALCLRPVGAGCDSDRHAVGAVAGGVIGIGAIYSDSLINLQGMTLTAAMITMSVFGAIVMYIISMLSLFKLRHSEPLLERTFRAPGYPLVPAIALILALVCLTAMVWFNLTIALVFLGFMAVAFAYFQLTAHHRANAPADAMLTGA